MNDRDLEKKIAQLNSSQVPVGLDARIREALSEVKASTDTHHPARHLLPAAVALAMVVILLTAWIWNRGQNPRIAWAQVVQAVEQDLAAGTGIHLIVKDYLRFDRLEPGDVVETREIWVNRPFHARFEEHYEVSDDIPKQKRYFITSPVTRVYNPEGKLFVNHRSNLWGVTPSDTISPYYGTPENERMAGEIERWLDSWASYQEYDPESKGFVTPEGVFVGEEIFKGISTRVYDFTHEHGWAGHVSRCWLRKSDGRLVFMERYKEGYELPIMTSEVVAYDEVFESNLFEFAVPDGYENGHLIGLEGQPYVLNPSVVGLVMDDSSAKFYELDIDSSDPRAEAVKSDIDTDTPELSIWFENGSSVHLEGPAYWWLDDDTIGGRWGSTGGSYSGTIYYGVVRPKEKQRSGSNGYKYVDIIRAEEYDGVRPIRFKLVTYRMGRDHAKLAFDADLDGKWDAWCEIADPVEERINR